MELTDYRQLVEELRKQLNNYKKVPYGEAIGSPPPYTNVGGMVWNDPEPYFIERAADVITDLLDRAETAEARCEALNEKMKRDLENYHAGFALAESMRRSAEERAEKAEKEREAAVKDLRGVAIESCAECMYCLYRTARSFCQNCQDGSSWRWRGIKEE